MNVKNMAEAIIAMLEQSVDFQNYRIKTEAIIWHGFRDLLNALFLMRKYRERYSRTKHVADLSEAKKYEQMVDAMLKELEQQKNNQKQPTLWDNLNTSK